MDSFDFLRYFAALLLVLGLLGGFLFIARRGWVPGLPTIASLTGPNRERRLTIKDSLVLDPRRRVVIVRADDEEHVVLLGPERETVLTTRPAREDPVFEPEMPTDVLLEHDDAPDADGSPDAPKDEAPSPTDHKEASA